MNVFDKINRILEGKKKTVKTSIRTLTPAEIRRMLKDRLERLRRQTEPVSNRDRRAKEEAEAEISAKDAMDITKRTPFK